jgi:hypothetical protein
VQKPAEFDNEQSADDGALESLHTYNMRAKNQQRLCGNV